jgi:hypothetical protein
MTTSSLQLEISAICISQTNARTSLLLLDIVQIKGKTL